MYGDYELKVMFRDIAREIVKIGDVNIALERWHGQDVFNADGVIGIMARHLEHKNVEAALNILAEFANVGNEKVIDVDKLLGRDSYQFRPVK